MKKYTLFFAVLFVLGLSACSKNTPPPPAPLKTAEELRQDNLARSNDNAKLQAQLEQQRGNHRANLETALAGYFAISPRFKPASDWTTIPHNDDYIDESCPQGSGWAWANVMSTVVKDDKGQPMKYKVWCSVYSQSIGCFLDNDFKESVYAKQAKACNKNIPFPTKVFGG